MRRRRRPRAAAGRTWPTSPSRHELALGVLAAVGRRAPSGSRRRATASTRSPCAGAASERACELGARSPRRAARGRRRRRSASTAARQHCLGGALRVDGEAAVLALVDRRHQLELGVEVEHAPARRARAARCAMSTPSARAGAQQRQLGRVAARRSAPVGAARPSCTRRPPCRASAERGIARRRARRRRRLEVDSPSGVHTRTARIRFSVSVPVLSVQIDGRRAERLDRADSRLTTRPAPGEPADADGQRQRDGRQQPLGHVGHDQADREAEGAPSGRPATSHATGRNATPDRRPRRAAISQATRRTWRSSGLCSVVARWDSAAIRPELGAHAGREDQRRAPRRRCRWCR